MRTAQIGPDLRLKQSLLLCVERDALVVGLVRKVSFLWHRYCLIPAAKE